MAPFIYSGDHTIGEVIAYNQFLGNHIVHEFTSRNFDRVEESQRFSKLSPSLTKKSFKKLFIPEAKKNIPLMHVPRTGKVNATRKIFRGKYALLNYFAESFRDFAYADDEEVWIVFGGLIGDDAFKFARELEKEIMRLCPRAKVSLSHRLTPAVCAHTGDEVVGIVYLSRDIRPDEATGKDYCRFEAERIEKTRLMKEYITEISKISSLYLGSANPDLSNL